MNTFTIVVLHNIHANLITSSSYWRKVICAFKGNT